MGRDFMHLLRAQWDAERFVCVGLDSDLYKIPKCVEQTRFRDTMFEFNRRIIDAMKVNRIAAAFKLNSAFYEAQGPDGVNALVRTCEYIRNTYSDAVIILDAKRADIGDTNKAYARFAFAICGADAITVHPYLGREALKPFLERTDKGIIVLCRTSNAGAGEFQDLRLQHGEGEPLYLHVARQVSMEWNKGGNCALVTGGTYPEEIGNIRKVVGDMPLLIPGIGKQGGDLEKSVRNGRNSQNAGFLINSSSGIIFASSGEDFAEKAVVAARKLHEQIRMS